MSSLSHTISIVTPSPVKEVSSTTISIPTPITMGSEASMPEPIQEPSPDSANNSFREGSKLDYAFKILSKKNDLHYRKDIWEEMKNLGYTSPRGGKTPWLTLNAQLNGNPQTFKKLGKRSGIYRLIV